MRVTFQVVNRPFWLVRTFRSDRQPGLESANSGTAGVAAKAARADSRSRPARLFRDRKEIGGLNYVNTRNERRSDHTGGEVICPSMMPRSPSIGSSPRQR